MPRRNQVERVRDKLDSALHLADGMEKGVTDEDISEAVELLKLAANRFDRWLCRDMRSRPRWSRISENCVIRRKTTIRYEA